MTDPARTKQQPDRSGSTDTNHPKNAAPGQPKNAPERVPGQAIPVEERTSPQKVRIPKDDGHK